MWTFVGFRFFRFWYGCTGAEANRRSSMRSVRRESYILFSDIRCWRDFRFEAAPQYSEWAGNFHQSNGYRCWEVPVWFWRVREVAEKAEFPVCAERYRDWKWIWRMSRKVLSLLLHRYRNLKNVPVVRGSSPGIRKRAVPPCWWVPIFNLGRSIPSSSE